MADAVVDSPNLAQDSNLTQTSPKKAVSLREAMNQSFEEKGFRTGQTSKREPNAKLPGQGEGGDHFPGQDLTRGPKTKARDAAANGEAAPEPEPTEPKPKPEPKQRNVGGFTDTKPPNLEAPPEPPAPEPEIKPAAGTPAPEPDDVDAIKLHPNASKETQEGWDALKGKTKEYKNKYQEATKELEAIKTAAANGQTLTPELKAQIDRADQVLRTLDLKSHPQFYTQYQEPIDTGIDKLFGTIDEAWNPEANAAWLPKWKEDVKRLGVDGIDKEWWKQNVLDKIEDPDLKHEASQQIRSLYRLKGTRDAQIGELGDKAKYDQWVKGNWENHWQKYKGELTKTAGELSKDLASRGYDWAMPIEIKEGMDPTAKTRAEAHNLDHQKAANDFKEAVELINNMKPSDHAKVAATYTLAKRLESQMEDLTTERDTLLTKIQTMQKELDGYKRVRSAPGKPAATHAGPARRPAVKLGTGPGGARAALDEMAEDFLRGN